MEKFPKVKETQVVLLRASNATGIVLDEHFEVSTTDTQKVYSVFESINDSIEYIEGIMKQRNDIEFVVYDSRQNAIRQILPVNQKNKK